MGFEKAGETFLLAHSVVLVKGQVLGLRIFQKRKVFCGWLVPGTRREGLWDALFCHNAPYRLEG